MSELTHPVALQPKDADAAEHHHAAGARVPSFTELVYAHFAWWTETQNGSSNGGKVRDAYHRALTHYQNRHGEVVHAYWCSHVESAAALTEKRRGLPWATPIMSFHRESDWATQNAPDIARELHRCDDLAVRARIVLKGVRQQICLRLVMSCAAHLLALVDARAAHADERHTSAALVQERKALDDAEKYYRQAANGQAQIVYFTGMVFTAAVIALVGLLFLIDQWSSGVAALAAGATGAVVSVIQRINSGHFDLEYDVGRPYAFFLGALRPLIGGTFALIIAFAFTSGILHLPVSAKDPESDARLAIIVIAFVSGFSERWAQDTLAAAMPAAAPPKPDAPAAPAAAPPTEDAAAGRTTRRR